MIVRSRISRAFTLIEVLVALAIMSILLGGMTSAVLIASRALPDADDLSEHKATALNVADQIARDLTLASSLISTTADTVEFRVPDRGHGATGDEIVSYIWSGTPGDPLTLSYNGIVDITVCEDVHDFTLEYARTTVPLTRPPRVLLVVVTDLALSAQETARRTAMESWGFAVTPINATATVDQWDAAVADADVVYAPMDSPSSLATVLNALSIGVITEERALVQALGLASQTNWYWTGTIDIVDNAHTITQTMSLGTTRFFSSNDYYIYAQSNLAPGAQHLATISGNEMFLIVEMGDELRTIGPAAGRRVAMPWGDFSFDFNNVNADGHSIMRRAIVWAAAPTVIQSVDVNVQVGPELRTRASLRVPMLNLPDAP